MKIIEKGSGNLDGNIYVEKKRKGLGENKEGKREKYIQGKIGKVYFVKRKVVRRKFQFDL